MCSTTRRHWTRLAHAVFQMCLVWQPSSSTSTASNSPRRRRLRQRSQQEQEQHYQEQPRQEQPGRGPLSLSSAAAASFPRTLSSADSDPTAIIQTRIVNGRDAVQAHEDFPFFVQWYRGCGATLIHPDVVLTAAHCYSETLTDHRLRIEGDPDRTFLEVVQAVVHPEFNDDTNLINNNAYDFMLLQLDTPVPFLRPVPLHSGDAFPLMDQEDLVIIGYGLTTEEGKTATILQEATVQYHADCSFARYRPGKVGHDTMFCAHGEHNATHAVDSCQGDSGGPILRRTPQGWVQVGVTSWGEGCARPDAPGIYARTNVAYDWIQDQLCQLSQVPPPHCIFPINMPLTTTTATQLNDNEETIVSSTIGGEVGVSSSIIPHEDVSQSNLDQTLAALDSGNGTATATSTTTLTLRIDIHYDNFPQEISWALAQLRQHQQDPVLKYVSPRQTLSARNQNVSQHILHVEPGLYRLEIYDTVAGDGIVMSAAAVAAQDAIQVWQITTTSTTATVFGNTTETAQTKVGWNEDDQDEVESIISSNSQEEEDVSTIVTHHVDDTQLLWSHRGDFGEFVRAEVEVALSA